MHCRVRYLLNFDLKIRSGQVCNIQLYQGHTTYNLWNKWTKISDIETIILELNMIVKSGVVFFCFEILLAPSALPANLPGQFRLSGQLFLH